jgi:hypothetical protein
MNLKTKTAAVVTGVVVVGGLGMAPVFAANSAHTALHLRTAVRTSADSPRDPVHAASLDRASKDPASVDRPSKDPVSLDRASIDPASKGVTSNDPASRDTTSKDPVSLDTASTHAVSHTTVSPDRNSVDRPAKDG